MESCIGCNNIKISQIDSSAMLCTIFISFVAEIGVKNEKNRVSRMWEKAYSSIKTPKLQGRWTMTANGLLHFAVSPTVSLRNCPFEKYLDLHLVLNNLTCRSLKNCSDCLPIQPTCTIIRAFKDLSTTQE